MNNFKDYGFEADFEGEILSDIEDYYIGYYIETYPCLKEKQKIPTFWNKNTGSCYKGAGISNSKYNLNPIKKEWYENSDNFPCLVVDNNKKILCVNKYQYIKENNTHWVIYEKMGVNIYSLNLEYHRPATKEEVLVLLVKE